ncbi:hypothetical protein LTR82_009320 [Friedmanniomyces endolithicus]|uniref:UBC core domain-containing protein n=1 Tax=Friedmanniomyces endolithicus TaxID=329885 RepID=A0AAN6FP05_9PEZI|nr:hypothetical protein LTR82_009320 [Friedmanniomyces endolithicus]
MPRRQFVADLQKAQKDTLPLGICELQQGEDDGQFEFEFIGTPTSSIVEPVKITAIIPDVSEYPTSHEYMVYCGDDAPRMIGAALQGVRGTNRKTVFELLDIISATLTRSTPDRDGDTQMPDSQLETEDEESDQDVYDDDHEAFEISAHQPTLYAAASHRTQNATGRLFRSRVRADLLAAKTAGFRIGHLGHLMDGLNAFVTVSIRMSKLGISEEAMQAWHVDPKEYLVLIIQYPNGYKTNEELQACDSMRLTPNLAMRLCAAKKYKPTLQEAIKAFTTVKKNFQDDSTTSVLPGAQETGADENALRETFISKPLNGFFQESLVPMLRVRSSGGLDWGGAEAWYTEIASKGAGGTGIIPDRFYNPEAKNDTLPDIVTADHYSERSTAARSFPLLAMQFALRHFVRCTEFCLVCHRKLDVELEAIKPYVCDQSLCLYQYMTLGFGPSIEHEVLTQPQVVDLLISFCYNGASARKLRDFPDGLALVVPSVDLAQYHAPDPAFGYRGHAVPQAQSAKASREPQELPAHEVGFDRDRLEMIFFKKPDQCPVRRGSWIMLTTQSFDSSEMHCRVADVTYYPTISIDEPVVLSSTGVPNTSNVGMGSVNARPRTITPATTPRWNPASFTVYAQDFEQLDKAGKCISICKLLDTLPSVKALQEYLATKQPADLKYWVERISPAALSLLRWIIASNRACIMQVDGDSGSGVRGQERLYGMKDFVQFRFAMGAPDKEQRFITEVRKTTQRLELEYPTIFAFHGSPLPNWHMIIREGLHFKQIDHGRAYGDGVYHAKEASTSGGYSGMNGGLGYGAKGTARTAWANSQLRINSAIALNEIVNAPAEFQSHNPFYVVQHLDWIQTRYLFVQCQPAEGTVRSIEEKKPTNAHPQDPQRTPTGVSNPIVIPASAITSRGAASDTRAPTSQSPAKRIKGLGGFDDPIPIEDDSASDVTDAEDLAILFEEDDPEPEPVKTDPPSQTLTKRPKGAATDFVPGTLDFTTLPIMPEPAYANSASTRRLMKELAALQKLQNATALSDLGWHLDAEQISNPYQWILELHSFHVIDPHLPLVADMRRQNLHSLVLEIRFNRDFPFTPPYVRVIRPRFLSFAQGAGGHIVQGGAMCMELLTNTGWSSVSSMESVLMQIRLAIASQPPARLDLTAGARGDYGTGEAAEGYLRACRTHGWAVPPGFKEMAYGMPRAGSLGAGQ